MRKRLKTDSVIFTEFLREGKALHDNLYPSRIIVGEKSKRAEVFASLLAKGGLKKNVEVCYRREAEELIVANTYLACVVHFCELTICLNG